MLGCRVVFASSLLLVFMVSFFLRFCSCFCVFPLTFGYHHIGAFFLILYFLPSTACVCACCGRVFWTSMEHRFLVLFGRTWFGLLLLGLRRTVFPSAVLFLRLFGFFPLCPARWVRLCTPRCIPLLVLLSAVGVPLWLFGSCTLRLVFACPLGFGAFLLCFWCTPLLVCFVSLLLLACTPALAVVVLFVRSVLGSFVLLFFLCWAHSMLALLCFGLVFACCCLVTM